MTEKEDRILLAGIDDKFDRCAQQYRSTYTNFLDMRERSLAVKHLVPSGAKTVAEEALMLGGGVRCMFAGGYEDAERTIVLFLPDYADADEELAEILSVIRVKSPAMGRKLTHRDYLGSLLSLGIKREMTGDILVRDDGADIIVLSEIRDFLMMNYDKAGRTSLSLEVVPISELTVPERKCEIVKDTVASLRLDNVASVAFRLSRAKAAEAVRQGLVFVNGVQCEKIDRQIEEGDKLVIRGKGRAFLKEVGGRTRKDRVYIEIERQ